MLQLVIHRPNYHRINIPMRVVCFMITPDAWPRCRPNPKLFFVAEDVMDDLLALWSSWCCDDRKFAQRGLHSTFTFALCSVRADRYGRMAWNGWPCVKALFEFPSINTYVGFPCRFLYTKLGIRIARRRDRVAFLKLIAP